MRFIHQRITIVRSKRPHEESINDKLQWFGSSLGLFNLRDKDKSCFRIFIEIIKGRGKLLSSDDLALKLDLSRGTVIHHMNKLMESGIVVVEKNRYSLREKNLYVLMDEIEKDLLRTCEDLKKLCIEIDDGLE